MVPSAPATPTLSKVATTSAGVGARACRTRELMHLRFARPWRRRHTQPVSGGVDANRIGQPHRLGLELRRVLPPTQPVRLVCHLVPPFVPSYCTRAVRGNRAGSPCRAMACGSDAGVGARRLPHPMASASLAPVRQPPGDLPTFLTQGDNRATPRYSKRSPAAARYAEIVLRNAGRGHPGCHDGRDLRGQDDRAPRVPGLSSRSPFTSQFSSRSSRHKRCLARGSARPGVRRHSHRFGCAPTRRPDRKTG